MATDFAAGVCGACLTGHHIGERVGVLRLPVPGTTLIDADSEIAGRVFRSVHNTAPGAVRAPRPKSPPHADSGWFFTGHQVPKARMDRHQSDLVSVLTSTTGQCGRASGRSMTSPCTGAGGVLVTDVCINRQFAGGSSRDTSPDKRQIVALHLT